MSVKLLFDLDGTISDPLDGIAHCLNFALESFGYQTHPRSELCKYIGPPLDLTFIKLVNNDDQALIVKLVTKYRERFSAIGYTENFLYPHIKDVIHTLQKQSIPMAICTSKPEHFARKILEHFQLIEPFQFISGGDVGIEKWQQIVELKKHNFVDERTIMIGDRNVDIAAAKHSGLKSAGVLWGYGSMEELSVENPDYLLHNVTDLSTIL